MVGPLLDRACRLDDHVGNLPWLRDHDDVARLEMRDLGIDRLGHGRFGRRRDHAVVVGDDVPAGLRRISRLGELLMKGSGEGRPLRRRDDVDLLLRQVLREVLRYPLGRQREIAAAIRPDARGPGRSRLTLAEIVDGLTLSGCDGGDIDKRLDLVATRMTGPF